jgi:hypothetical protein
MYKSAITHEEVEVLPYVAFGGKITVVDKPEKVAAAVEALAAEAVIGYDTESRPSFTRGVKYGVSLVQLASAEEAFLFRVDKIGIPQELVALLQNGEVLKVGAAVSEDIRGMQRLGRFTPKGFVDLQQMVEAYSVTEKSLKKMAAIVLNFRISKSQQTSNWSALRYTAEQKLYAATDAWVCREIYLKLLLAAPDVPLESMNMNPDGTLRPVPPKPKPQPRPQPASTHPRRHRRRGGKGRHKPKPTAEDLTI